MIRKLAIAALLGLPVVFLWPLIAMPAASELNLPGGLPLGNLLVALALAAWPAAARLLSPPRSAARRFAGFALVLAMAWLPVSAALAGNLALNFSGDRGTAWLAFTLVVAFAAVVSLAWSVVKRLKTRTTQ